MEEEKFHCIQTFPVIKIKGRSDMAFLAKPPLLAKTLLITVMPSSERIYNLGVLISGSAQFRRLWRYHAVAAGS